MAQLIRGLRNAKKEEGGGKVGEGRDEKCGGEEVDNNDCAGLLEENRKAVVADERAISATLDKLNVYGAGGRARRRVYHFVTFRSTHSSFLMYLLSEQT